jgi:hypothetical protein
MTTLNFPYYKYPKLPFCGYFDTLHYNEELLRLFNMFDTILSIPDILFHLTIGAPMEECIVEHKINLNQRSQWMQLFPHHFNQHAKTGKKCVQFIVAPNITFSDDRYVEPLFVGYTNDEYKWERKTSRHFISTVYDCEVHIFYTMLPTIDITNESFILRLKQMKQDMPTTIVEVDKYIQTSHDREFTLQFYQKLADTVDMVSTCGGYITCFNFAVFNAEIIAPRGKCFMFKELEMAICNGPNVLLAEWTFYMDNHLMSSELHDKGISYIDAKYSKSGDHIVISYPHNKFFFSPAFVRPDRPIMLTT